MTHEQHLSDEQLSAQLDGELHPPPRGGHDEGDGAHLTACAACRRRRDALAAARALVGTPVVPVMPSVKEAAVATALAGGLAEEPVGEPAVTVLASRRPTRRLLVGAAAAVALVVVGVSVSLGLSHGVAPSTTVASATGGHGPASTSTAALGTPQASAVRPAASGTSLAGSGTAEGVPALAPVSSPGALKAGLAPLLASRGDLKASGTTTSGNASAQASVAPPGPFEVAGGVVGAAAPCVTPAVTAAAGTGTGTVVLVVTTTYRHTPALAVVVQEATTSTAAPTDIAVVVARSGCRVLTRTTL